MLQGLWCHCGHSFDLYVAIKLSSRNTPRFLRQWFWWGVLSRTCRMDCLWA